jgi:hypothetical protein
VDGALGVTLGATVGTYEDGVNVGSNDEGDTVGAVDGKADGWREGADVHHHALLP